MSTPPGLADIISEDVDLRCIEPDIYTVYETGESPGAYDSAGASTIYDVVACNRLYNWLMWGYSISNYKVLCEGCLKSSSGGWILDLACGSLAFTADVYAKASKGPVVFLDQSLKLLKKGKRRLERRGVDIAGRFFFLHADALRLPFRSNSFHTVICLNLLHCLNDIATAIAEIKRVLSDTGRASLTTLVERGRWSDSYLSMLAGSGALVSRSLSDVTKAFDEVAVTITCEVKGNLAFIECPKGG